MTGPETKAIPFTSTRNRIAVRLSKDEIVNITVPDVPVERNEKGEVTKSESALTLHDTFQHANDPATLDLLYEPNYASNLLFEANKLKHQNGLGGMLVKQLQDKVKSLSPDDVRAMGNGQQQELLIQLAQETIAEMQAARKDGLKPTFVVTRTSTTKDSNAAYVEAAKIMRGAGVDDATIIAGLTAKVGESVAKAIVANL